MRRSLLLLAATLLSLVAGLVTTPVTSASATPTAVSAATHSIIVRPVTAAGHASDGFHVTAQGARIAIDCSFKDPSAGAVSPNIEECSPSAAYAIACWKSAKSQHALCTRNPSSKRLYSIKLMGSFAKTPVVKAKWQAPLVFVLDDGTTCSIRDGGAWGSLKSHPKWAGSYSCAKHGVVWSPPHANHAGINESGATWTVHTGSGGGNGKLTVRGITTAYFVGTASG